jgi:hypothetical protein
MRDAKSSDAGRVRQFFPIPTRISRLIVRENYETNLRSNTRRSGRRPVRGACSWRADGDEPFGVSALALRRFAGRFGMALSRLGPIVALAGGLIALVFSSLQLRHCRSRDHHGPSPNLARR